MENKTLKYITTICFAIIAVWFIVDLIDYFNFLGLTAAVGSIFVVIALLTATPILSTVGFALLSIRILYTLMSCFEQILHGYGNIPFMLVPFWVVWLAVYILLIIAGIKPTSAKTLGLVATILAVVRLVALVIINVIEGYGIRANTILLGLLLAAGAMLLGLTYDNFSKKEAMNKAVAAQDSNVPAQRILEDNNVEKLMRLKSFLDEGVITQEEFDEKKKQLLGL